MSYEQVGELGKWLNVSGQEFSDDSVCFVYLVEFPLLCKKYVGYKATVSRKTGKPVKWVDYKTSSKLVKNLLSEGNKAEWYILKIFSDHDDGYSYERSELIRRDVLGSNKDVYLNQSIGHTKMSRLPESYTEEAILAAREGLIRHIQSDEYQHPMTGKQHPNKGKKLPQTAPKKHVSVDNIQITDGVVNKWWPKNKIIPEGFRRGMTSRRCISEAEAKKRVEIMREANKAIMEKKIDSYERNPNTCYICDKALDYSEKNHKTCSGECRSIHRSRVSSKIKFSQDSIQRGLSKRMNGYAKSKGFDNYEDMCKQVIEMCKGHTIKYVASEVGISVTGVQGCMRYLGFSLSEYRRNQK